jgi:hypothetical protein
MASDNWTFWDDATMSVYLGSQGEGENRLANALFVYPRQKMMVSRLNAVLYALDAVPDPDESLMRLVEKLRGAFSGFNLFRVQNIPVKVRQKGQYSSEFVRWDSKQIIVDRLGLYADHNAVWEAALPISQQLSVGGFFVDKKRPGARNKKTTAQLDLMFNPTYKNGSPNLFYTLPATVNAALTSVPGLELFTIEKPSRSNMVEDTTLTSLDVSGFLNHIGIYAAVMLHGLAKQLMTSQELYTTWVKG